MNELDQIEIALEQKAQLIKVDSANPDMGEIRRTAYRHTAARNVIEFSFTQLLSALLSLISGTYYHYARGLAASTPSKSKREE